MGRPISYEMQMMFVGSPGAFEEAMNTGSGITRLDFIQGYDFSFNIDRAPLKQIGSDSFATRQTQLAPDINLNIQYLLNDGWNEKYLGLDIEQYILSNPFDTILSSTGDRNFYISIAKDDGKDQNLQGEVVNSNILAIGNAYITSYEISVAVNQLATVSCSFIGSNASVQDYEASKYLPSVNTIVSGQNAQDANKKFALSFAKNDRAQAYIPKATQTFNGGCPYSKCKITPDFQSGGGASPITFGFFDAIANNFQSMQFSVQFERKALYGFGNNHPFTRKVQRPIVATLSLSALIDDFQAENLSKVFHAEGGIKSSMLIEFFNLSGSKKFALSLKNLTLESYSLGARIGDRVLVETSWTVEVNSGAGSNVEMEGSYRNGILDTTLVNESFSVSELFSEISAQGVNSYGVAKDGYLWTWGDNSGSEGFFKNYKTTPLKIFETFKVNEIETSGFHTVFLDKNGKAWAWGLNNVGQLGDNSLTSRASPVPVYGNKTFCKIAVSSGGHTIAIDKDGKAWGWGDVRYVGINQIPFATVTTPVAVLNSGLYLTDPLVYPYTLSFCKITAEFNHTLAIDKFGKAWAWGFNPGGSLGTNTITGWAAPYPVYGNKTFCEISTGTHHTLGIDKYGKLWAWGQRNYGAVGDGGAAIASGNAITPVAICQNKIFCKIAAGSRSSYAIDNSGLIWAWGNNQDGQLGIGDPSAQSDISILTPMSIAGIRKTFCKIVSGGGHAIATDKYGKIWAWGSSAGGRLGNSLLQDCCTPKAIAGANKTFCQIGGFMAIDKNGKAWGWGTNGYGQLGNNSVLLAATPVSVYGNKTFCKISGSYSFTIAIDKYGKAWGWGYNGYGQLGTNIQAVTPVAVCGNKTFCKIFTWYNRSFGVDKNNKAWGWGYGGYGSLGTGPDNYATYSPVALCTSRTFCHIDAQGKVALDSQGKIWGWGYYYDNIIGLPLGTLLSPVSLPTSKTFCKINFNGQKMHAIDKNGKLWLWGNNIYNVVGEPGSSRSPREVCTNKTFCEIFTRSDTVYGIDKNGKSWAWGNPSFYRIGDGQNVTSRITPTAICGNKQFCKIQSEGNSVFGLDKNGKIWTWGSYAGGRLGQNIPFSYTPVRVHNF